MENQPLITKKNIFYLLGIVLAVGLLISTVLFLTNIFTTKETVVEKEGFHADWFSLNEHPMNAIYTINKNYVSPHQKEINRWVTEEVIGEAGTIDEVKVYLGIKGSMEAVLSMVQEEEKEKTVQQAGVYYNGATNDMQVLYTEKPLVIHATEQTKFYTDKDVVPFTGISMLAEEKVYVFMYQNEALVAVREYPSPYRLVDKLFLYPMNYVTEEQRAYLLSMIKEPEEE